MFVVGMFDKTIQPLLIDDELEVFVYLKALIHVGRREASPPACVFVCLPPQPTNHSCRWESFQKLFAHNKIL
jgi:hypothetical protein